MSVDVCLKKNLDNSGVLDQICRCREDGGLGGRRKGQRGRFSVPLF